MPDIQGRELLDDHALARTRLVGALTQDVRWRERRDRGTTRRLIGGTVLALLVCAVLAAATFVSTQLAEQRRLARERARPLPTVTAPAVVSPPPARRARSATPAPVGTAPAR